MPIVQYARQALKEVSAISEAVPYKASEREISVPLADGATLSGYVCAKDVSEEESRKMCGGSLPQ